MNLKNVCESTEGTFELILEKITPDIIKTPTKMVDKHVR